MNIYTAPTVYSYIYCYRIRLRVLLPYRGRLSPGVPVCSGGADAPGCVPTVRGGIAPGLPFRRCKVTTIFGYMQIFTEIKFSKSGR